MSTFQTPETSGAYTGPLEDPFERFYEELRNVRRALHDSQSGRLSSSELIALDIEVNGSYSRTTDEVSSIDVSQVLPRFR